MLYYLNLNPQPNTGDYEVHQDGCYWLTLVKDKKYLGSYSSCTPAVTEAKKTYSDADGCKHCCPSCHTS